MEKSQIKNEIYQCGFFFMLGATITAIVLSCFFFNKPQQVKEVFKESVVHDTIVAHTNLNEYNLKLELKKTGIKHPEVVLAQAKLETGYFTSKVSKTHNNIFGIRTKNQYRKYGHWKDCVADYKRCIQSRYNGGNYYAFLERIGYAEDPKYINKLKQIV